MCFMAAKVPLLGFGVEAINLVHIMVDPEHGFIQFRGGGGHWIPGTIFMQF